MTTTEIIESMLDEAVREGRPLPSLRAIRAKVGHGSLTTISSAVKAWRTKQMVEAGELPEKFSESEAASVSAVVWQTVSPILQQRIEEVRRSAQERIDLEVAEAQKLSQTAQEMLDEAEAVRKEAEGREAERTKELAEVRSSLDKAQGALEEARKELEELRKQLDAVRSERDAALKAAAVAEASADSIRRLVPFLDPKHVAGTKSKK